jgi:hypothetical protein
VRAAPQSAKHILDTQPQSRSRLKPMEAFMKRVAVRRTSGCGRRGSRGVEIRTGTDPVRNPSLLAGFDHVVVATGARYPRGLGRIIRRALRMQLARNGLLRPLTSSDAARDWFYYRLRRAAGADVKRTLRPSASVEIIGDAGSAGKAEQAILSAYEAAFGSNPGEAMEGDGT